MILIIDSGSTKMGWILLDGQKVAAHFVTKGFNPNYADIQFLENLIVDAEKTHLTSSNYHFVASQETISTDARRDKSSSLQVEIHSIHYYGTGCGSEQNCQLIKGVFQQHFPQAEIAVTHDLMAACHALLGHEKGIACILGTGSNSCVYDGENITERAVSLGYLVGDEGSGMHIGREVVKSYFYGFMPDGLKQQFEAAYHPDLKVFIDKLYHDGQPSRYLATFAKFAGEHQNEPFIRALVERCFDEFIKAFILRFGDYKSLKVNFVGSVAYHFRDILKETLETSKIKVGEIMASPTDGLVRYYSE